MFGRRIFPTYPFEEAFFSPLARHDHGRADGFCIHCNKCLPTIYGGTRCVLVPAPDPRERNGRSLPDSARNARGSLIGTPRGGAVW
jgi:hypothetical protein